jgi:hypothetical protein
MHCGGNRYGGQYSNYINCKRQFVKKKNYDRWTGLFIPTSLEKHCKNEALLSILAAHFREHLVLMFPKSGAWFVMPDILFDEPGWYATFRVSRQTFQYLLVSIEYEITHTTKRSDDTDSAKCRLAITFILFGKHIRIPHYCQSVKIDYYASFASLSLFQLSQCFLLYVSL